MIVVSVRLVSAIDPSRDRELARMVISNDGSSAGTRRNYKARTFMGRCKDALDLHVIKREGHVKNWPSEHVHVWNLVAVALANMGYGMRGMSSKEKEKA